MRSIDELLEREPLGGARRRGGGSAGDRGKGLVIILRAADAVQFERAAADVAAGVERDLLPVGVVHLDDRAVAALLRIPRATGVGVPVVAALAERGEAGLVVAVGFRINGAAHFRREHVGAVG